jgi:transposase
VSAQEQNPLARQLWRALCHVLPIQKLVFVDECGSNLAMTPTFAWAKKGQRAYAKTPRNRGQNTTILGAVGWSGWQAGLTLEGAADTIVFETFVEKILLPTLKPGSVIVMDNLSIHKSHQTRRLIEEAGCSLFFLPTYSPDFNPIEQAWSKLKTFLRQQQARSRQALDQAISHGLHLISQHDVRAWFRHCGYQSG